MTVGKLNAEKLLPPYYVPAKELSEHFFEDQKYGESILYFDFSKEIKQRQREIKRQVLVVFWTSTCATCQVSLQKLNQKYEKEMFRPVLAINVDKNHKIGNRAIRKWGLRFVSIHDQDHWLRNYFKIKALPHYLLLTYQHDKTRWLVQDLHTPF